MIKMQIGNMRSCLETTTFVALSAEERPGPSPSRNSVCEQFSKEEGQTDRHTETYTYTPETKNVNFIASGLQSYFVAGLVLSLQSSSVAQQPGHLPEPPMKNFQNSIMGVRVLQPWESNTQLLPLNGQANGSRVSLFEGVEVRLEECMCPYLLNLTQETACACHLQHGASHTCVGWPSHAI